MTTKYIGLLLFAVMLILLLPGCGKKGETSRPDILLITIDTLRRGHLGCYGYPRETSPFIDSIAEKALVYENTLTPIPLTDGSHATILTGLHPLAHGVIANATRLNERVTTIAEVLKAKGYYTMGTVAVEHMHRNFQFNQGFDSYSDSWDRKKKHNRKYQRIARWVNESAFAQLETYKAEHSDKPLFMWVHYYDPHTPYIDWEHIDCGGKEAQSPLHGVYDKEVRYTDDHIKALYGFLESKGLTENLVTCITADHGEQLGEHGFTKRHCDFYSENTFVPLMFYGPGIPQKRVNRYVSTMDIAPTLLALAGADFDYPVHGKPLLEPERKSKKDFLIIGNPKYNRSIQLVRGLYSYIRNFDGYYKDWYITTREDFPEELLRPVAEKHLRQIKNTEKPRAFKKRLIVKYPSSLRQELHYGVLRFDVTKNRGLAVGFRVSTQTLKDVHIFEKPRTGTVTCFFPITPLDTPRGFVYTKKGTKIANPRYAVIPAGTFRTEVNLENIETKISGHYVFEQLGTLRKHHTSDELFNLGTDFAMEKNRLKTHAAEAGVMEMKKSIYRYLKFYRKENKRVLRDSDRSRKLSKRDMEMLKSLGYL